ncbi:ABC transporter ATP-binding protein [Heyndrickxia ginsengihumi]|uniref:ABC transporter ATP-binding protein n=1 Tax=Heyndrickxia ginsengihumi TaxID=363870 RepID=UPI00046F7F24|nr:ABC transporter ATP-binding protein [Heyndrickxia ginsengihumi]MBE6184201.1 ABC transporter ATP-binding protein [Bacillus sp. (in: firmicutes)]MCM3023442.1 ABC transporter ATP-binding protein [Heyndrickxia ginsengihumi]
MSNITLSVKDLTKKIKSKTIVDHVSFEVKKGEIFGLLGPNGAGKTTIIRMIVGLINKTAGEVSINGYNLDSKYTQAMNQIGAIVENPEFYNYMSGYKNLLHYKRMSEKDLPNDRIYEVAKLLKIDHALKQKVKTYSLGMRQRLGVAQAILHSPSVLILDEPTNGLDPQGIREFRENLRELTKHGVSILISSHLLSEMELMCDRYAIIEQGKLIHIESMNETTNLEEDLLREVTFTTDDSEQAQKVIKEAKNIPVNVLSPTQISVSITYNEIADMNKLLVENDRKVFEIVFVKKTLEDRFLELTNQSTEVNPL